MEKANHDVKFKRISDGRTAKIVRTQAFPDKGITIYTLEFEDDRTRGSILESNFSKQWEEAK